MQYDDSVFKSPGNPGHPSSARPAVLMMVVLGCASSVCEHVAELWQNIGSQAQYAEQVWRVDCDGSTDARALAWCDEATGSGQLTAEAPTFFFWDGRGAWSPYTGERSLQALSGAIMTTLSSEVPDLQVTFDAIYRSDAWVENGSPGSGDGSHVAKNRQSLLALEKLMEEHNVGSVVEVGCGDFEVMRHGNLDGVNYHGYDVSAVAIARARQYESARVRFSVSNADTQYEAADLLIVKDVLQHLPFAEIRKILAQLPRFRVAVIVNDVVSEVANADVDGRTGLPMRPGAYRKVDVTRAPFGVDCARHEWLHEANFGVHSPEYKLWYRKQFRAASFKMACIVMRAEEGKQEL